MLEIAIGALVIALIAGALGFTGVARAASTVAKIAFVIFLILALLLFLLLWAGISLVSWRICRVRQRLGPDVATRRNGPFEDQGDRTRSKFLWGGTNG